MVRARYKTKWHPLIVLKGSANTYTTVRTCETRTNRLLRLLIPLPFFVCLVPFDRHIFVRVVPSRCWTTVAGCASIITALRFAVAPRAPRLCIYADLSCALPRVYNRVSNVCTHVKNLNIHRQRISLR